jgi:hypothetical protein
MAYRESDHLRYNQFDFIVGYEVKRSNRNYPCDVCETLKGKYPKSFKFVGWHPQCMCFVVAILASEDEMDVITDMILNNEDTSKFKSKLEVNALPSNFTGFVNEKKESILKAAQLPYFVRDNLKFDELSFAK